MFCLARQRRAGLCSSGRRYNKWIYREAGGSTGAVLKQSARVAANLLVVDLLQLWCEDAEVSVASFSAMTSQVPLQFCTRLCHTDAVTETLSPETAAMG